MFDQLDDRHTIGAPIHEIAHKNKGPIGTSPLGIHSESGQQGPERFDLPMDITDDIHTIRKQLRHQVNFLLSHARI
jgi:tetrahydromethanopterin S-methyltransferase subunit A